MGKSQVIPIVVQEYTRQGWRHFGTWRTKDMGKANSINLEKYRQKFVDSTKKGGCNEHLGLTNTGNLRIVRQKDGVILAEYFAPMFEVL